jgi:hypothetical protein
MRRSGLNTSPTADKQSLVIPNDEKIARLCSFVLEKNRKEEVKRRYAPVKKILSFIGEASIIAGGFVSPGMASVAQSMLTESYTRRQKEWQQYNPSLLRRSLRRLQQQKVVTITQKGNQQIVTLTDKGRRKILQYSLEDITIERPSRWDGKWRLILYDVSNEKKKSRDLFRYALKALCFYQLQESVWIYPYPCDDQIAFLREFYSIGNDALYIVADKFKNDAPYRTYFGI